ncbi:MAG: 50S ribosomal protein L13 [Alphaproteobacteria bacterium]|nr:50S ribosomal protein L13 [Rickettsiales bacterium]
MSEKKEDFNPDNLPKSRNKTLFVSHKKKEEYKKWVLIDADGFTLGKLAVVIADFLRGKNKPYYTPHTDCGDNVVVVNAAKVYLSGNKEITKTYYRHTGYPGGLKTKNVKTIRSEKFPERILKSAVKGMLSSGAMSYARMRNLHLFAGSNHTHAAQKPQLIDFASMHKKHRSDQ